MLDFLSYYKYTQCRAAPPPRARREEKNEKASSGGERRYSSPRGKQLTLQTSNCTWNLLLNVRVLNQGKVITV